MNDAWLFNRLRAFRRAVLLSHCPCDWSLEGWVCLRSGARSNVYYDAVLGGNYSNNTAATTTTTTTITTNNNKKKTTTTTEQTESVTPGIRGPGVTDSVSPPPPPTTTTTATTTTTTTTTALRALRGSSGALWAVLGTLGGALGAPWGPWGDLVGSLASTLGPLGAETDLRAKKEAKSQSVSNHLGVPRSLLRNLRLPLGPPWGPVLAPRAPKRRSKQCVFRRR